MKRACALVLAIACALPAAGRRGEAAPDRPERRKRLSREETIELFRKLHAAAPNSKTFQARLTRTEESRGSTTARSSSCARTASGRR